VPEDATPTTRLEVVESELKRMKDESSATSVQMHLNQVRTLARRPTSTNDGLLAAVEALYDVANATGHKQTESYKTALQACRENCSGGRLHSLVTKLLGTEAAQKAQTAIDAWKKAESKAAKTEAHESPSSGSKQEAAPRLDSGFPNFPGFPWFPWGPPPFSGRPFRGRGRGRGAGPPSGRQCFICKSPDHVLNECPFNTFKKPN